MVKKPVVLPNEWFCCSCTSLGPAVFDERDQIELKALCMT